MIAYILLFLFVTIGIFNLIMAACLNIRMNGQSFVTVSRSGRALYPQTLEVNLSKFLVHPRSIYSLLSRLSCLVPSVTTNLQRRMISLQFGV